jgi:hypothetical protein
MQCLQRFEPGGSAGGQDRGDYAAEHGDRHEDREHGHWQFEDESVVAQRVRDQGGQPDAER